MKIIVAGAGSIGKTLIEDLQEENHDIVAIDSNYALVAKLMEDYDISALQGNCVSADCLKEAGAEKADLLIACTPYDEMNILCCMIAKKIGVRETVARVRNPDYFSMFRDADLGLTMMINPEYETAMEINRLLRYPSALKIEPFAGGKVEMAELKINEHSPLCNIALKDLGKFPEKLIVCAVNRNGEVHIPSGSFTLRAGDEIYLTATPRDIISLLKKSNMSKSAKKVMIAGGSRTAFYLAQELSKNKNCSVKIVEISEEKGMKLSEQLCDRVDIVCGDATDRDVLEDEGIEDYDAFVALCGNDETNILMSLFASYKEIPKIITKINRFDCFDYLKQRDGQSTVSVSSACVNEIVRYVRGRQHGNGGSFSKLYRIVDDKAELLEFLVSADFKGAGVPLKNLRLQDETLFAAIVRKDELIIPGGNDTIMEGDIVILVTAKESIGNLNDIFR